MDSSIGPHESSSGARPYRVLARKYRPTGFDGLIGQEALVRTLGNAFRTGRLAHAFMLSGVRGVGKTTTARIIARALNCVGPEGLGGAMASPCGVCEHCRAIGEDRHVDVLEVDAASRTGVDDIRELIDGVRYRPTSGRYKVYIVDEVHMLSKNAFNALLKTLEEPPEHVRFIFATTEIRKVPVTVLSRCQRFDLRRIDAATLVRHFAGIAAEEGARISEPALQMIARAADGSVRDGLSLLDQAIAHAQGEVDEETIRQMLGLADRSVVFDLFEAAMAGGIADALRLMAEQHAAGADPAVVLEDMLDLVHWLTRIKVTPEACDAAGVPEAERVQGRRMADALGMAELTRAWQILLKGLGETRTAPAPLQAAEMVLVRLAYAARLPTPAEALQAWGRDGNEARGGEGPTASATSASTASPRGSALPARGETRAVSSATAVQPGPSVPPHVSDPMTSAARPAAGQMPAGQMPAGQTSVAAATAAVDVEVRAATVAATAPMSEPDSFEAVVALVSACREAVLQSHLVSAVHLVRFEPGRIELRLTDRAPNDLPRQLSRLLNEHTPRRWLVTVSKAEGAPTLHDQREALEAARLAEAAAHPLVRAVLATFPGARIAAVRDPAPGATEADTSSDDESVDGEPVDGEMGGEP